MQSACAIKDALRRAKAVREDDRAFARRTLKLFARARAGKPCARRGETLCRKCRNSMSYRNCAEGWPGLPSHAVASSTRTMFCLELGLGRIQMSGNCADFAEGCLAYDNVLDVVCVLDHSFGHEKAGSKIEVIARSTHRDGDRFRLPRVRGAIGELNLERFLDRKIDPPPCRDVRPVTFSTADCDMESSDALAGARREEAFMMSFPLHSYTLVPLPLRLHARPRWFNAFNATRPDLT